MSDEWILERIRNFTEGGQIGLRYSDCKLDEYQIAYYECSRCGGYDKYYSLWNERDAILTDEILDPDDICKVLCCRCSKNEGKEADCVKRESVSYSIPSKNT